MVGQADFHGRLGDTTLVYWAEGAEPAYGSAFMAMMGMGGEEKNEITQKELNGVLTALCQGRTVNWANVPRTRKTDSIFWTCAECVQIIRAIFPAGFLRRICRAFRSIRSG